MVAAYNGLSGVYKIAFWQGRFLKMSRKLCMFFALLFFAYLAEFVYAQESASQFRAVIAILGKSEEVDDGKIEKELRDAFAKTVAEQGGARALELQEAFSPEAKAVLKNDSYKKLLELPELIARSDRIRRNLQAEGVLVGNIEVFGKYGKSYFISLDMVVYDIRGDKVVELDLGPLNLKSELERPAFVQSVADSIVERMQREIPGMKVREPKNSHESRVLCNPKSKFYHLLSSHHLPPKTVNAQELDQSEAVKLGYKPCAICFPELCKRIGAESTEAMLGAEVAGFIEYYYRVSTNPQLHERVDKVGRQILAANGFKKRNYIFTVLNSDEINAFTAPGGYVYVTSGMLDVLESDDELACVLAHEIAHVEQEHGLKQYRRAQKTAAIGILVSVISGQDMSILAEFVRELVMRGYDRKYEKEADRYGYMYVRRTSFDPESYFILLGKLLDMELSNDIKIASWLRTHPKAEDRLKYIEEYKADMQKTAQYLSELGKVDSGLAVATCENQTKYVDSIDRLKSFVEIVKLLP